MAHVDPLCLERHLFSSLLLKSLGANLSLSFSAITGCGRQDGWTAHTAVAS